MPDVLLMAGGPSSQGWGAFGKMPALGDFFRMGVAADFVTAWDAWLQKMLLAGRQRLGEGWEGAYMSAPLWRFALGPGIAGGGAVAGVLMPSVDRVGRQFPLTLVVPISGEPLQVMAAARPLWAMVEDLALDCLEDGMTREALEARLGALPLPGAGGGHVSSLGAVTLAEGAGVEGALVALTGRLPEVVLAAEVGGVGRLMLAGSLPGAEEAVVMFQGGAGVEGGDPA